MKYSSIVSTGIILALLVILVTTLSLVHLITESWWFSAVGYDAVFWTRVTWQIGVGFGLFWVYVAGLLGTYTWAMHLTRHHPFQLQIQSRRLGRDRWRAPNNRIPTAIAIGLSLFLAFTAVGTSGDLWELVLQYLNPSSFAIADPIYSQDISFYVFRLPLYQWLQQALLSLGLWCLMIALAVYGLKGELSLTRGWHHGVTGAAKIHLCLLLAAIALAVAAGFWLARYDLLYSPEGVVYGAGFTDVHARLSSYWFMGISTLVLAVLFIGSLWQRSVALPAFGISIYVLALVLVGGLYPWFQQQFMVQPNELTKETPYIAHSIDLTRQAYNLETVERQDYPVEHQLDQAAIAANASTIDNIRLWDYRPLLATYQQLQEIRLYYRFSDVDVDRYTLDDTYQQVMLAAREMDYNRLPNEAKTWVNQRLKYTHGFGAVMSPVNRVTRNGLPEFLIQDIPPVSNTSVEIRQPRIYYGETADTYVFTGMGTDEFDYPRSEGNAANRYNGLGGVPLPTWFHRLAYALDRGDITILISNYFTPESRILYHRPIIERVQQIAPFLRYDNDPYLALVDGRMQWIIDAYTVSDRFPYAAPVARSPDFGRAFQGSNIQQVLRLNTNYIRNSVKVVIDAYDGVPQFYVVDDEDPLLQTYRRIFPALFRDRQDATPALQAHFRYPADLFRIQAQMFTVYHMSNPEEFYNREDVWRFPLEMYENQQVVMEPYYVIMELPDSNGPEFTLILPFTPASRDNMIAWMAARSDGPHYGKLLLYEFPKQELIYGPRQVEARIDQDPEISQQLTLWSQEGSRVIRGDLLVIPVQRSLLYVEPVYLRAEQGALPELRRVILAYDDQVVMEPSLEEAIAAIFGSPDPAARPTADVTGIPVPPALVEDALTAYQNAQTALQQGDWAGYGRYQQELGELLERLNQPSGEPVPTP
jgi:uncharacterized membrane protein (UPF0182 family)